MKFNHAAILLILLVTGQHLMAQEQEIKDAEKFANERDYKNAILTYQAAIAKTQLNGEISKIEFSIAKCYSGWLDYEQAAKHFEMAYTKDDKNYEALFMLAVSLKKNGQQSEAITYYKKYASESRDKKRIVDELKSCESGIEWKKNPMPFNVSVIRELSCPTLDFSPVLLDDQSMMYTSTRASARQKGTGNIYTNIYFTKLSNDHWSSPETLDTVLNKNNNIGSITMDKERKVMIFTMCPIRNNKSYPCGLYYTFMQGGMIGQPMKLSFDIPEEEKYVFGHPTYSNELNALFFVSNLPGGQGGKDIWFSKYDSLSDTWGKPQNAGTKINTSSDEMFPFINPDGSLYFSSAGHIGMGGWDIFKAPKAKGFSWGEAENLKYPINSEGDDFAINFRTDGKSGYFASNRKGGVGEDDIYGFSIIGKNEKDSLISGSSNEPYTTKDSIISDKTNETYKTLVKLFNPEECNMNSDILTITSTKVYPNPNNGDFTFEFNCNKETELTLRIYSSNGQVVYVEPIRSEGRKVSKQINLSNISSGVYYIQVLKNCEALSNSKVIIK